MRYVGSVRCLGVKWALSLADVSIGWNFPVAL